MGALKPAPRRALEAVAVEARPYVYGVAEDQDEDQDDFTDWWAP